MSLKRFIAQKDTTIVAAKAGYSETNYGKDEILQLGRALEDTTSGSAKILVRFSDEDLESIASLVGAHEYRAKIHLTVARALNIPESLEIVGTPITEYWEEGFGKAAEEGNMLGATWTYRMPGVPWSNPGDETGVYDGERAEHTGEDDVYDGEDADTLFFVVRINGGGALTGIEYPEEYSGYVPCWNIDLDITELVKYWTTGILDNNGIALFVGNGNYWADEYGTHISLFSVDSHTVYQPYLEIEWDDSEFDPEAPSLDNNFKLTVSNLQAEYTISDEIRFNVGVKDLYPSRVFSTSSLYKPNYVLPEGSLWGIADEYTNELVAGFDENYAKVSSRDGQSYFDFDMSMLYPERFYRLLFKVPTAVGSRVVDNKIIFKVIRDGQVC